MGLIFLPFFLYLAAKRELLRSSSYWIFTLAGVLILFMSYTIKIWAPSDLEKIYFLAWPLIWLPSFFGFLKKPDKRTFDHLIVWWSGVTSALPLVQRVDLKYSELPGTLSLILLILVALTYGRLEYKEKRKQVSQES